MESWIEVIDGYKVSKREIEQTLGFSNTSISACCRGLSFW